jgi:hypothetical protein
MRKFLFLPILFVAIQVVSAQNKEQMEVIKDYKADIPETPRFELNANFLPTDTSNRKQRFNLILRPFEVSYLTPNLKPLRMISEEIPDHYPGFLSIGIGLPLHRNLVGHYAISPNAQSIISFDIKHLGMNNDKSTENQKFSSSDGNVNAEVFTKAGYTIAGNFNYRQQNRYFYGYHRYNLENNRVSSFSSSQVRRQFQDLGGKFSFYNHLPTVGKIDYKADIEVRSFSDNLKNTEIGFQTKAGLGYWITESNALAIDLLADLNKYTYDKDSIQRLHRFFISPSYSFHGNQWRIKAGANVGMNNGNMVVLPNIEMAYNLLADKMALFLGINGNIEKQNFRLLANENPFLADNISLRNTKNTEIFAGLKGESGPLSLNIDASHRSLDHLAMYVTNGDSLPKFKVLYDTAKIISFGGEFNYQIKDNINVSAAIKQRIYKLNNEMKAWHLPSFTAVFGFGYTKNKLNINMDMNIENGVPYLASEGPLTLDPLLALNLGVRYRITKQIEAFIQLNNLLNNKRQRWQYYENIGINFLGGIQMRF